MSDKGLAVIGLGAVVGTGLLFTLIFNYFFSVIPSTEASIGITDILPMILLAGAIILIFIAAGRANSF